MAQQKRRPNTMVYGNLAYDLDTLASQRQLEENPRARSAKLRVAEKCGFDL